MRCVVAIILVMCIILSSLHERFVSRMRNYRLETVWITNCEQKEGVGVEKYDYTPLQSELNQDQLLCSQWYSTLKGNNDKV